MKELKEDKIYIEDFDITVSHYLTYAQITEIVKAMKQFDNWKDREEAKDMLMALYLTDIGAEKLEAIGHDNLVLSGLMDKIQFECFNSYLIDEAIGFEENPTRVVEQLMKDLPNLVKPLKKVISDHENKSSTK